MSEDLVKRARGWDFCWPSHDVEMLMPAMADRIEELEAKLAKAMMGLSVMLPAAQQMSNPKMENTIRTTLAELNKE